MNRTKIEWTNYTWNPITGCLHGCPYCYAREIANRFDKGDFSPKFHPDRLENGPTLVKKPSMVFVCSMSDIGGDFIQPEWIDLILSTVDKCPQHIFQFLTKRPDNLQKWFKTYRKNVWLGTTIERSEQLWRLEAIKRIKTTPVKFISFEPLQGPIESDLSGIEWIIIGAQTGKVARLPEIKWVTSLITQARKAGVSIFMKNSLEEMGIPMLQEWPEVTS